MMMMMMTTKMVIQIVGLSPTLTNLWGFSRMEPWEKEIIWLTPQVNNLFRDSHNEDYENKREDGHALIKYANIHVMLRLPRIILLLRYEINTVHDKIQFFYMRIPINTAYTILHKISYLNVY